MEYAEALAYLESRSSYERSGRIESPSTDTIERLCWVLGDPQHSAPVVHITGTNGKGSTAQMITRILMAAGLKVGTYTSPHLERINERMQIDGEPISDREFGEHVGAIAEIEEIAGVRPGFFDICTAAAFRWFADDVVDVMVVEVGLLGRWDATNVVSSSVAVITNIGLDHTEFAGPTKAHIAREKAGIIKPSSVVVTGETDPELLEIFAAEGGAQLLARDVDFEILANDLAVGGRVVDLRTPLATYQEVFVPLHGRHQGENLAVSLCAVEALFGQPVSSEVLEDAMAMVSMPGRFEVMSHQPLVVIDGAHNPAGADVCASVFFQDFDPAGRRMLVVGCLNGRDPDELLSALRADEFDRIAVCTAPSPRGRPASELAAAARRLGCDPDDVVQVESVADAIDTLLSGAGPDDAVLVTGSLYVVGAARAHLRHRLT